jgi:hypothetical protein
MTLEKSTPLKCELCGFTLPVNATVCPKCGGNLSLIKLIEEIPSAVPTRKPSVVPAKVLPPESDKKTKAVYQVKPTPMILPKPAVASVNRGNPEREAEETRLPQSEDSIVRNAPPKGSATLAAESTIASLKNLFAALFTASKADTLHKPRSHGISKAWIFSAILLAALIFLSIEYIGKSNQWQAMRSEQPTLQNPGIIQDERLSQAESTIAAQQKIIMAQKNTMTAQQIPTTAQQNPTITPETVPANQIDLNRTLLLGPLDGTLIHNNDGLIKTFWAEQYSKNFILYVVLVNPYSGAFHSWDTCIRFRRNYTDEYRLTILSTHRWELTRSLSIEPIASGTLTNLKTGEAESNTVYLEVRDGIASLKVNDELLPNMDVSVYQESGDVGIAIGSQVGDEVDGRTTVFKEFTLWNIP